MRLVHIIHRTDYDDEYSFITHSQHRSKPPLPGHCPIT
jgi:hypothetical protein